MLCILVQENFKRTLQLFQSTWTVASRMKGTLYAHRFLHPNQVMNAVVIKDANKAVNHAWPTDNSGLPLSW